MGRMNWTATCYALNTMLKMLSWEKDRWAIKLRALLTGRGMDVYTRMSDADASLQVEEGSLNEVQLH